MLKPEENELITRTGPGTPMGEWFRRFWLPVMLAEAETMRSMFAQDYERYSKEVPLFAPRFTPYREGYRSGNRRGFDLGLYLQHREYRAAIGFVVAYGLLVAKIMIALA